MDRVRGIVDRMMAEEDARIEALRREVLRDLLVAGGIALLTTVVTVAVLVGLNKLCVDMCATARAPKTPCANPIRC